MPSVKIEEDIIRWLEFTQSVFKYLPIELQLVWLYEIMVRICLRDKPNSFKQVDDSYVISSRRFHRIISNKTDRGSISILYNFRNHFVHLGYFDISSDWNDCLCNKKSIDALAKQYGVSLNWSKTVALEML